MKFTDMSREVCRVCKYTDLDIFQKVNAETLQMLRAIKPSNVRTDDRLPKLICIPCGANLKDFYDFKSLYESTLVKFRNKRIDQKQSETPLVNFSRDSSSMSIMDYSTAEELSDNNDENYDLNEDREKPLEHRGMNVESEIIFCDDNQKQDQKSKLEKPADATFAAKDPHVSTKEQNMNQMLEQQAKNNFTNSGFWKILEAEIRTRIPFQKLLTIQGYDNDLAMAALSAGNIDEMEAYVRQYNSKEEAETDCGPLNFPGAISKFKIFSGHRHCLMAASQQCKQRVDAAKQVNFTASQLAVEANKPQPVKVPAKVEKRVMRCETEEDWLRNLCRSEAERRADKISEKAMKSIDFINIKVIQTGKALYDAVISCGLCPHITNLKKEKRYWTASNFVTHLERKHGTAETLPTTKPPAYSSGQKSVTEVSKRLHPGTQTSIDLTQTCHDISGKLIRHKKQNVEKDVMSCEREANLLRDLCRSGAKGHVDEINEDARKSIDYMNIKVIQSGNASYNAVINCGLCRRITRLKKGKRNWVASNFITHLRRTHGTAENPPKTKISVYSTSQKSVAEVYKRFHPGTHSLNKRPSTTQICHDTSEVLQRLNKDKDNDLHESLVQSLTELDFQLAGKKDARLSNLAQ